MKTKQLFALCIVVVMSLSNCKKYEEGPILSLRTKTARVANTWKVASYTSNGTDYTSLFTNANYTETYDKDGNYSYTSSWGSGAGKWEFQSDKKEIKRSGVAGQSTETLVILKLKEKEFWYYYMDGKDKEEFHLEQK